MAVDHQTCKLEDLCRLCLEGPGCIDINETYLLSQNIYLCTGIEVSVADSLPKTICKSCFGIVNNAIHLRTIASKNDMHLKELIHSSICLRGLKLQHEKENVFQEKTNNFECTKATLDNENHNKESFTHSDSKEESHQPKIIKVRTDLFRTSFNKEPSDIKNISSESMDVGHHTYFDESMELNCDVCSKRFETRKKLYLHKRLHNKTHTCTVHKCEKKFASKNDLEKHIRTHTGEKPFVCNFCEKGFSQSGTLKVHMKSVHGMCKVEIREVFIV